MSKNPRPTVVVILGATASGKSSLAVRLAKKFDGEIISADSRQVYRGFDIGSGKILPSEQHNIRHHLLSFADPKKTFTLAEWQAMAEQNITNILARGRLPIIVGGTGLYLSSLIDCYQLPKGRRSMKLRLSLEKKNVAQLLARLKKIDPETAASIDHKNKRRLARALEYVLSTGQSLKASQNKGRQDSPYDFMIIGLRPDKVELQRLIKRRVRAMMRQGLRNEVERLVKKYGWRGSTMHGIGYREWQSYFEGRETLADVESAIIKNTWQYARRQMTWFRGMERKHRIHWARNASETSPIIKKFLGRRHPSSSPHEIRQTANTARSRTS